MNSTWLVTLPSPSFASPLPRPYLNSTWLLSPCPSHPSLRPYPDLPSTRPGYTVTLPFSPFLFHPSLCPHTRKRRWAQCLSFIWRLLPCPFRSSVTVLYVRQIVCYVKLIILHLFFRDSFIAAMNENYIPSELCLSLLAFAPWAER